EVAFQRCGLRIKVVDKDNISLGGLQKFLSRAQTGGFHRLGYFKHVESFGDHYRVYVNVAPRQAAVHLNEIGRMIEKVFTRLQGVGMNHEMPEQESCGT